MADSEIDNADDESFAEGKMGGEEADEVELVGPCVQVDGHLERLD
jgi:hypothetical protein